jgi:hypothetical protein
MGMTTDEKLKLAEQALCEIANLGAVCEDFALCYHQACNDSCSACSAALEYFHTTEQPSPLMPGFWKGTK